MSEARWPATMTPDDVAGMFGATASTSATSPSRSSNVSWCSSTLNASDFFW